MVTQQQMKLKTFEEAAKPPFGSHPGVEEVSSPAICRQFRESRAGWQAHLRISCQRAFDNDYLP